MTIKWEIWRTVPNKVLVHREEISREALAERVALFANANISPLASLEPEYTEEFLIWCVNYGEPNSTYEILLVDSVTQEVFQSTMAIPERSPTS